tara:strand:- start:292 stop:510 length:219 start_codon:yes stop_codon:yes gene_type:complete
MARRKVGSTHTTISITWKDKESFRRFAKLVKETRNGEMYESDAVVFNKILKHYIENNKPDSNTAKSTYPTKS